MNVAFISEKPKTAKSSSSFKGWWDAGYRDLLPVVPPDANVSPKSHVAHGKGKSPGIKYPTGLWGGFQGWNTHQATEQDVDDWQRMGASVGLRFGVAWLLDLDIYDEATADMVEQRAIEMLGPAPMRVGQWPKRALLYRNDGSITPRKLRFAGKQGEVNLIEIPPQAVVQGIHAKTGKPYEWRRPPGKFQNLTIVSADALASFLKKMRSILPSAGNVEGASETTVKQETLKGDPDVVAAAMAKMPNTREMRWDYMIRMGYALKAALPDHSDIAFTLWDDWCERWEDDGYDPGAQETRWASMKGPYRAGASWIYEEAERQSGGSYSAASAWFENLETISPLEANPFIHPKDADNDAVDEFQPTAFSIRPLAELPMRRWVYGYHLIRGFISATVAPSGVGKSSLAIAEALAMASGKPLLGVTPRGQFRVWLWNGEDPADELERRVAAAIHFYQLTQEDIGDRLFVDSGRDTEIILARSQRDGATIVRPVATALEAALRNRRIDVMSIDPLVSSHRVSENDNGDIDLVAKQWANIADRCGAAIELVHHVRKGNGQETTVDDARGAGALIAATRSARVLTKMTRGEAARLGLAEGSHKRLFRFGDAKNNLALPADERASWMELASVALGNGPGEGADKLMGGDSVGVVARWAGSAAASSTTADADQRALDAIAGGDWLMSSASPSKWVGAPVASALNLVVDDPEDKALIKAWIKAMVHAGRLRGEQRQDASRHWRQFAEVVSK